MSLALLPVELLLQVLGYLEPKTLLPVACTSRKLHDVAGERLDLYRTYGRVIVANDTDGESRSAKNRFNELGLLANFSLQNSWVTEYTEELKLKIPLPERSFDRAPQALETLDERLRSLSYVPLELLERDPEGVHPLLAFDRFYRLFSQGFSWGLNPWALDVCLHLFANVTSVHLVDCRRTDISWLAVLMKHSRLRTFTLGDCDPRALIVVTIELLRSNRHPEVESRELRLVKTDKSGTCITLVKLLPYDDASQALRVYDRAYITKSIEQSLRNLHQQTKLLVNQAGDPIDTDQYAWNRTGRGVQWRIPAE